jgi:flagella basal body P-ring formation protein FlgA
MAMIRAAIVCSLVVCAYTLSAHGASLRPHAAVHGDTVRLADIFDDAGPAGDTAVLRAPAPGKRYALDAAWLAEAARVHGIAWRPHHRYERVVIERIGRSFSAEDIHAALRAALEREGAPADTQIEFAGRAPDIAVAIDAPATLEIQSIGYDRNNHRFSALILAGAGHSAAARVSVSGRLVATRSVPVLRRALQPGEIVRRDDVELVQRRVDQLRRDALLEPERVIGQSPRRALRAGEALREGDLRAPLLVPRHGVVTIVLRAGNMTLTAQGKALDEGARGETIRVLNLQSKKTLEAAVIGPDLVAVTAPLRTALAN